MIKVDSNNVSRINFYILPYHTSIKWNRGDGLYFKCIDPLCLAIINTLYETKANCLTLSPNSTRVRSPEVLDITKERCIKETTIIPTIYHEERTKLHSNHRDNDNIRLFVRHAAVLPLVLSDLVEVRFCPLEDREEIDINRTAFAGYVSKYCAEGIHCQQWNHYDRYRYQIQILVGGIQRAKCTETSTVGYQHSNTNCCKRNLSFKTTLINPHSFSAWKFDSSVVESYKTNYTCNGISIVIWIYL